MKAKIAIGVFVLVVVAQASWVSDATTATIPAKPASGNLHGKPFTPKVVALEKLGLNTASQNGKVKDKAQAYILKFASDNDFFPAQDISVWFSTDQGEKLAGKSILMKPYAFGTDGFRNQAYGKRSGSLVARGVTGIFTSSNKSKSSDQFSDKFSIRLTFGTPTKTSIPGKVYLSLPDKSKSYLAGTFTAKISSTP